MLGKNPGTYCLELEANQPFSVRIGKNHNLQGLKGYYYYVGSAFGPGGLAARIRHHCRISIRPHWHIDYIKAAIPVIAVAYTCHALKQEHQWAEILSNNGFLPEMGIGASDCDCASHFFYRDRPAAEDLQSMLKARYTKIEVAYESA